MNNFMQVTQPNLYIIHSIIDKQNYTYTILLI